MEAVVDAVEEKLIIPVLIGPRTRILAAAKEAKIDLSKWELIDAEHSHAAAAKAVELAAAGKVDALMKGSSAYGGASGSHCAVYFRSAHGAPHEPCFCHVHSDYPSR